MKEKRGGKKRKAMSTKTKLIMVSSEHVPIKLEKNPFFWKNQINSNKFKSLKEEYPHNIAINHEMKQ